MKIRVVQMRIGVSVEENLDRSKKFLQEITIHQNTISPIDVILFPEMFISGFDDPERIKNNAFTLTGNFLTPFQDIASKLSCYIILGSLPLDDGGRLFNTSLVISPNGEIIYRYDKLNLFPLMNEAKIFTAGQENLFSNPSINSVFTLDKDEESLSSLVRICYDLRFPEIFRDLKSGYYPEVIFLPMQWPAPRTKTFRSLAQARAIENQAYVVVCNRVGGDNQNIFEGNSMAVGPDGTILAELGNKESCLDVELSSIKLREYRTFYPFLKNFSYSNKFFKKTKPLNKVLSK